MLNPPPLNPSGWASPSPAVRERGLNLKPPARRLDRSDAVGVLPVVDGEDLAAGIERARVAEVLVRQVVADHERVLDVPALAFVVGQHGTDAERRPAPADGA